MSPSLTEQPTQSDSIPPSLLPYGKNLSSTLVFVYPEKRYTNFRSCKYQNMGLEPPCRHGVGECRKEEKQLLAEVRGILQGTPESDFDPLTAAMQRQSSLLHC